MVDMGADAVICCHAHCPQPWENYAGKPIVYGLGNLIFESRKEPASWYEGYLAKLIFDEKNIRLEVIPYVQSLKNIGAQKMEENVRKRFLDEMQEKAVQVKNIGFLEEQWLKYCRQHKDIYLAELLGYNRLLVKIFSLLNKRLHFKEERVRKALHLVRCEAYQEILNTIFKDERQGA